MRRTTIKLPDEVDARLRHEASRRGVPIAVVVREAVEAHLGIGQRRRLIGAGMGNSGRTDISQNIEEILREEWNPLED